MSDILRKPYELSLWEDYYDSNNVLQERKVLIIGSNNMTSPARATDIKLTSNINGTHSLSFTMYYRYQDTITGEWEENEFAKYLANESKIKLYYDDEWYDLIIKGIVENSEKYTFTYTATDLYINELSKTGYELVFDEKTDNNMGSASELITTVLNGTNWELNGTSSETIAQTNIENLYQMTMKVTMLVHYLSKDNLGNVLESEGTIEVPRNATIYAFYSCCANKTSKFQFIYVAGTPQKDSDRVITNGTQCYVNNVTYNEGTINYPTFTNTPSLNTEYRGERFVFTQVMKLEPALNKYVSKYSKSDEDYWGYVDTKYIAPNIISNYVANHTDFENTSGWYVGTTGGLQSSSTYWPTIEAITYPSVAEKIADRQPLSGLTYTPILRCTIPVDTSNTYIPVIVNSGFQEYRSKIKSLTEGQQFVCYVRFCDTSGSLIVPDSTDLKLAIKVADSDYDAETGNYTTIDSSNTYISWTGSWTAVGNYYYNIATVSKSISEENFKSSSTHMNIFLTFDNSSDSRVFDIYDFQIFPAVNGAFVLPESQTPTVQIENTYYYYKDATITDAQAMNYTSISTSPDTSYTPVYTSGCEKIRSISVKESNRFNILQEIAETFECWLSFDLSHDSTGRITGRRVTIHNYIGQDNGVDFVYGIDLKSIQRTVDSKQIATKIIIKDNSNKYAKDGFCSIVKANNNFSGEGYIYNFDYYINQGMLDAAGFETDLYSSFNGGNGYYNQLKAINKILREDSEKLANQSVPLAQAKADVSLYQESLNAANTSFQDLDATIRKEYNNSYTEVITATANPSTELYKRLYGVDRTKDEQLAKYIVEGAQYQGKISQYNAKLTAATENLNNYQTAYDNIQTEIDTYTTLKKTLNTAFFQKYYRYIQEGTWKDDSYIDSELYYLDAESVAYESAAPKVSYTINVMSLEGLGDYDLRTFKLGDRTHIQDTEFFGWTTITTGGHTYKTPVREAITITEVTYSLDNPQNNTIKVQNYRTQFQDLFQRITATTQQVQYSSGAYERAAALADADSAAKVEFLQQALNDASLILTNMGEQSVIWDTSGITVTDVQNPMQKLRLVSGAILLTTTGGQSWATAMTAKGVSASLLTAGQVDTSVIQIMNGTEAYFRWDALGITAYDFSNDESQGGPWLKGLNTYKGVRFDRFGIYGYEGIDGATWHPDAISGTNNSIDKHALFYLTWEGLKIRLRNAVYKNNGSTAISWNVYPYAYLGKVDDYIYNKWVNGLPTYDSTDTQSRKFVRLMAVGTTVDNNSRSDNFCLYSDGTLVVENIKLPGTIEWTAVSSPFKQAYCLVNNNGIPTVKYSELSDTAPEGTPNAWHKVRQDNDKYFANTGDAGATWDGPFLIQGEQATSNYVLDLSDEYASIPCDEDGNFKSSFSTTTTATVYYGSSVSTGWTIVATSDDFTTSVSGSTVSISASSLTGTTGEVTITASKTDCPTLTTTFNAAKLYQGEKAISYWLTTSLKAIGKTEAGAFKETSLVLTPMAKLGDGSPVVMTNAVLKVKVDTGTTATYTNCGTKTFNLGSSSGYLNPTSNISIEMYLSDGTTKVDMESVPVVVDGETGQPGSPGDTIELTYLYHLSTTTTAPTYHATDYTTNISTYGWQTTPQAVDATNLYCFAFAFKRTTTYTSSITYSNLGTPVIWGSFSKKGDKGDTGDTGTHGVDVQTQDIFYRQSANDIPATLPTTWCETSTEANDSWTTYSSLMGNSTKSFVFKSVQTKTTSYSDATTPITPSVITYTQPYLYRAYHDVYNTVKQETYAEYLILSNGGTNNGLQYGTDGTLSINATFIKSGAIDADLITTGALEISNSTSTIFKADASNKTVTIGGFTVTNTTTAGSIYQGKTSLDAATAGVYLGTNGIALGYNSTIGTPFSVTEDGELTAKSGTIGGWTIDDGKLYSSYNSSNFTGLQSGSSVTTKAFFAGATDSTGTSAVFYVQQNGYLYAISGSIGGWTLSSTRFYKEYTVSSTNYYTGLQTGSTAGTKLIYAGASDSTGSDAVFYVQQNGYMYASSGLIGGWTLDTTKLYNQYTVGSTNYYTGLQTGNTATTKLIYAGATDTSGSSAAFYVRQDGYLYASSGGFGVDADGTVERANCFFHIGTCVAYTNGDHSYYAPVLYTNNGQDMPVLDMGNKDNNITHLGGDGFSLQTREGGDYITIIRPQFLWFSGNEDYGIIQAIDIQSNGITFWSANNDEITATGILSNNNRYVLGKIAPNITSSYAGLNVTGNWTFSGTTTINTLVGNYGTTLPSSGTPGEVFFLV